MTRSALMSAEAAEVNELGTSLVAGGCLTGRNVTPFFLRSSLAYRPKGTGSGRRERDGTVFCLLKTKSSGDSGQAKNSGLVMVYLTTGTLLVPGMEFHLKG